MRSSFQAGYWCVRPVPVENQNHGSRAASNESSHSFPRSCSAMRASTSSGPLPSNVSSTPSSTASFASLRSSSSGRVIRISIPTTIFVIVWSAIPGKASRQYAIRT